ncbi:MAG: lytic murein transglycosylase [Paracoccaceae bacterium]
MLVVQGALVFGAATPVAAQSGEAGFQRWVQGYARRAVAAGLPRTTVQQGLRSARYLPDVIRLDRTQSEFTKPIWTYLDTAVSDTRIKNGRAMLRKHDRILRRIQARYGVDRHVVVAIWGLESAYGSYTGTTDTASALATLAYDGRRGAFFERQLTALLRMSARGQVRLPVQGSWAGAMGHTQFIPTSYQAFAVDGDGDGIANIFDNRTDTLHSIANYFRDSGWRPGIPWGVRRVR